MIPEKLLEKGKYWSRPWSLITGCSPVSESCQNCWLASMEYRFDKTPGVLKVENGIRKSVFNGNVIFHEDRLDIPRRTKKPQVYSVWSDLFHPAVPAKFIIEAFERMEYCNQHTFLVLTKRPKTIEPVLFGQEGGFYMGSGDYMPNVWLGTTVENQAMADKRRPFLITGADQFKIFLSVEPLLSEINLSRIQTGDTFYPLSLINQVIVGAESGLCRRHCNIDWIRSIVQQCQEAGVPVFVKQIHINDKVVKDINLFPEDIRVRELAWIEHGT